MVLACKQCADASGSLLFVSVFIEKDFESCVNNASCRRVGADCTTGLCQNGM